ncbi:MAG TPA: cysteine desulfurase family protein [Nitrososphaeraceae archaeon]|nr:cysteine desulfurase family protein [Nitrososphaeraceae archaeon]
MNLTMTQSDLIYFDNAATTPVLSEVIQEMVPYLGYHYGNPSSQHSFGFDTSRAIEKARSHVAQLIGSSPNEITFTSGGTEANNLAIKGSISRIGINNDNERAVLISSSIEHDSVLQPFNSLKAQGFIVKFAEVNGEGIIKLESLLDILRQDKTMLVSIMLANNEVGTIQPIRELAKITHENSNALFHCDAVQALGKIPIDVKHLGVDLLSLSSHKIYGPKGVGALYVRDRDQLSPLIDGGGQEKSLRSGTENVYGIVGFGEACRIATANLMDNRRIVKKLRDYLIDRVLSSIPRCQLHGSISERLPNNAHFSFPGVKGEDIIVKLNEYGIAASTGAACSSNKAKPSHVLKAMGLSLLEIEGSLRLTLGHQNTMNEVERVVLALEEIIRELRRHSGFSNN